MFHNWAKKNIVGSIHHEKIAFLDGGVSNLADSHPNIHLRVGDRHQLNSSVCFKSNKHIIHLFWCDVLVKRLVYIHHCVIQSALRTCIILVFQ